MSNVFRRCLLLAALFYAVAAPPAQAQGILSREDHIGARMGWAPEQVVASIATEKRFAYLGKAPTPSDTLQDEKMSFMGPSEDGVYELAYHIKRHRVVAAVLDVGPDLGPTVIDCFNHWFPRAMTPDGTAWFTPYAEVNIRKFPQSPHYFIFFLPVDPQRRARAIDSYK